MKARIIIFISMVYLLVSCVSWKNFMVENGNNNDAIRNAIIDFVNTNKLQKENSVFFIDVVQMSDKIIAVDIIGDDDKLYPTPQNRIGTNEPNFPTQFIELNDKLFFWYDSTTVISYELINLLSKYDHIDSINVNGIFEIRGLFDDAKKGAHYYFCKDNLLNYKKLTTNKALGYYKPPKLHCGR